MLFFFFSAPVGENDTFDVSAKRQKKAKLVDTNEKQSRMGASNSRLFQIDTNVPKMLLFKSDLTQPFVDASEWSDAPPCRSVPVTKLGEYSLAILKPGESESLGQFSRIVDVDWFFFRFLFFHRNCVVVN